MNSKRILAIILFGGLIACLIFLFRQQHEFTQELKGVASAAVGAELCEFRSDEARECKALAGDAEGSALKNLLGELSAATAATPPGKVSIVRERIVRLRGRAIPEGQYSGCYRLLEFQGFPGEYVTEVEMDPGCVQITKYRAGSARTSHAIQ